MLKLVTFFLFTAPKHPVCTASSMNPDHPGSHQKVTMESLQSYQNVGFKN